MLKLEYLHFMQTLNTNAVPDNVRKLANIILDHLDEIIPLGTTHGKRVQKIVELAQHEFTTANCNYLVEVGNYQTSTNDITRLKSLTVGPFRGFAKSEFFDLDSQIVLLYGPNGSGKSSFCEALEYGLLGYVEEAGAKRFKTPNDYLKNAHIDQFEPPKIEANFANTEATVVRANEAQFRFCFVEKNRIDNFSRLAAHLPARQAELISTLFGLDSFNDFVRGFSEKIDDKYIDLIGKKSLALSEKKQSIIGKKQTIDNNNITLKSLLTEEQTLADKYQQGITFTDY
ncbi:MAG: AAA family ATPase, partial [Methylovulum sp.]|nr:AAA family ATPase [Methylovulum sp.]